MTTCGSDDPKHRGTVESKKQDGRSDALTEYDWCDAAFHDQPAETRKADRSPTEVAEEKIREAHEASEHLLIHHANMDKGSVGALGVQRDAFLSKCVAPHECWNRLEVALNLAVLAAKWAQVSEDIGTVGVSKYGTALPVNNLTLAEMNMAEAWGDATIKSAQRMLEQVRDRLRRAYKEASKP